MGVSPPSGMTGEAAARRILNSNGAYDVDIQLISGHLTDHYDPRTKVLRLSESVYHGNTVAAIGVAAHEAGHAIQDAKHYLPLRFRMAIVPICNIGSHLAFPLFFIGLMFSYMATFGGALMFAGIVAFSLSVFFQLVTLPVEFNASRRAIRCLQDSNLLGDEDLKGARKVLSAAALTYVAALAVGLLSLLRLLLIAGSTRRRK